MIKIVPYLGLGKVKHRMKHQIGSNLAFAPLGAQAQVQYGALAESATSLFTQDYLL